MDVGEMTLMLTRFPEPLPVSGFSASASGARKSRERRRTVLLDADGGSSDDEGRRW